MVNCCVAAVMDGDVNNEPCDCPACKQDASHQLHCLWCGCCYFGFYGKDSYQDYDYDHEFHDGTGWFCSICFEDIFNNRQSTGVNFIQKRYEKQSGQNFSVNDEGTPPAWFRNCMDEITSKIASLDIKFSSEVGLLATNLNAFVTQNKGFHAFSDSPVRKLPTPSSAWDNVDMHPKMPVFNDSSVLENLVTPLTYTDIRKDSQCSKNVKINVKCKDANNRSQMLKTISKDFDNFPNFLSKFKSDNSIDILVDSFAKAQLAKETLQEKIHATVSNPVSLRSKLYNISGIPYELSKEEALQALVKENPKFNFVIDDHIDASVFVKSNPNARLSIKRVVQCRSGMYRIIANITEPLVAIIHGQELVVEHTLCKLYEITKHNLCFKCLLPGHFANNCVNPVVCSRCSGEHSFKECKSDFVKCVFCVRKNLCDHSHPSYLCSHKHTS